jgi:hypothetical protein
MQDFWETTSKSTRSNMFSALNSALVKKGSNLADAYHALAITARFTKPCGAGYGYPFCFAEAIGYAGRTGPTALQQQGTIATVGASYTGAVVDNYALNWIGLPISNASYTVMLQNTAGGGRLRGSIVCDTGSTLRITPLPAVVGAGAKSMLTNVNTRNCASAVLVLTNQAHTANNPTESSPRSYQIRTVAVVIRPAVYLPLMLKRTP